MEAQTNCPEIHSSVYVTTSTLCTSILEKELTYIKACMYTKQGVLHASQSQKKKQNKHSLKLSFVHQQCIQIAFHQAVVQRKPNPSLITLTEHHLANVGSSF